MKKEEKVCVQMRARKEVQKTIANKGNLGKAVRGSVALSSSKFCYCICNVYTLDTLSIHVSTSTLTAHNPLECL